MQTQTQISFDQTTTDLLSWIAQINPSIKFNGTNQVKVISAAGNSYARIAFSDKVLPEIGIFDLSSFIRMLSLFANASVIIDQDSSTITMENENKSASGVFVGCDLHLIVDPPATDVGSNLTDLGASCFLSDAIIAAINKSARGIAANTVTFSFEQGTGLVGIKIWNNEVPNTNRISLSADLDEPAKETFSLSFSVEDLKFFGGGYKASFSSEGLAIFTKDTQSHNIYYAVAANEQ